MPRVTGKISVPHASAWNRNNEKMRWLADCCFRPCPKRCSIFLSYNVNESTNNKQVRKKGKRVFFLLISHNLTLVPSLSSQQLDGVTAEFTAQNQLSLLLFRAWKFSNVYSVVFNESTRRKKETLCWVKESSWQRGHMNTANKNRSFITWLRMVSCCPIGSCSLKDNRVCRKISLLGLPANQYKQKTFLIRSSYNEMFTSLIKQCFWN